MPKEVKPKAREVASSSGSTIRVVTERTGLPMLTLRAWERRYGFPSPERRPGSNRRLYSEADVQRLMHIRRALNAGYRVGDIISKTIPELDALTTGAARAMGATSIETTRVEDFIEMLSTDRVTELERCLRAAATTLGPRRFLSDLVHPFAVAIGEGWAQGRLSVRHEHIATECLTTQLRWMLAAYQDIESRPMVLLATLPGEPHILALQMVALYLRALGASPRLLGASTPTSEIAECARVFNADIVGLTVTATMDRRAAAAGVRALRKSLPADIPLWLGGNAAASVVQSLAGVTVVAAWSDIDVALDAWRTRESPVQRH